MLLDFIENEVRGSFSELCVCCARFYCVLFLDFWQYGEVDIDGSLVAAKTTGAEDIVMLNNGCLCCTVRGDLVRMIAELVNKKKGRFDHIVIETTGRHCLYSRFLFYNCTRRTEEFMQFVCRIGESSTYHSDILCRGSGFQ